MHLFPFTFWGPVTILLLAMSRQWCGTAPNSCIVVTARHKVAMVADNRGELVLLGTTAIQLYRV